MSSPGATGEQESRRKTQQAMNTVNRKGRWRRTHSAPSYHHGDPGGSEDHLNLTEVLVGPTDALCHPVLWSRQEKFPRRHHVFLTLGRRSDILPTSRLYREPSRWNPSPASSPRLSKKEALCDGTRQPTQGRTSLVPRLHLHFSQPGAVSRERPLSPSTLEWVLAVLGRVRG